MEVPIREHRELRPRKWAEITTEQKEATCALTRPCSAWDGGPNISISEEPTP